VLIDEFIFGFYEMCIVDDELLMEVCVLAVFDWVVYCKFCF